MSTEQTPIDEILPRDSGVADHGPIDIPRPTLDRELEKPAVSDRLSEAKRIADELEAENRAFKAAQEREEIIAQRQEAERQQREFAQFEAEVQADQPPSYEDRLRKQGANKVRFEQLQTTHPEFVERANANYQSIPLRGDLVDVLYDCDAPMDVAVLIGNHPEAIAELNALSPRDARRWVEKFDERIAAGLNPQQQHHRQEQRERSGHTPIGDIFPSNLAGARNVGRRSGPGWTGPKPLADIFKR